MPWLYECHAVVQPARGTDRNGTGLKCCRNNLRTLTSETIKARTGHDHTTTLVATDCTARIHERTIATPGAAWLDHRVFLRRLASRLPMVAAPRLHKSLSPPYFSIDDGAFDTLTLMLRQPRWKGLHFLIESATLWIWRRYLPLLPVLTIRSRATPTHWRAVDR